MKRDNRQNGRRGNVVPFPSRGFEPIGKIAERLVKSLNRRN